MKIVMIDGLCRDHVADVLIAENVCPQYAEHIAEDLNKTYGDNESYYVVKPDDYVLSRGLEDLI